MERVDDALFELLWQRELLRAEVADGEIMDRFALIHQGANLGADT